MAGATASPIPTNLGSSLNRLELHYYLMPKVTNGSQLTQYPSLTGLGIGGALLPSGTLPLYGLHVQLPSSSLFGEIGLDGESIQNPGLSSAAGATTPSPFSYNNRGGGSQTRNALTLGIGVKF